jgi:hypothetical protein
VAAYRRGEDGGYFSDLAGVISCRCPPAILITTYLGRYVSTMARNGNPPSPRPARSVDSPTSPYAGSGVSGLGIILLQRDYTRWATFYLHGAVHIEDCHTSANMSLSPASLLT